MATIDFYACICIYDSTHQQGGRYARHYIDDDESGRFFDRSAYSRMMEDVESGKIGVCIMKDLTRWGRDYLQVGNAMEIFRRNNVRFIAVNNGIDSENSRIKAREYWARKKAQTAAAPPA